MEFVRTFRSGLCEDIPHPELWKSFESRADGRTDGRRRDEKYGNFLSATRSPFVRFVRPFLALMAPISLRMIYTRTLFGMRRRRRRKPSEASVVPASEVEDTSGRSCEIKSNERSLFGENALNMELFCSDIFGFC